MTTPCPMTTEQLAEWCSRSPYGLIYNSRYREGFALVHDDHYPYAMPYIPIVAEGEQARRFPAMVEAARQAALAVARGS